MRMKQYNLGDAVGFYKVQLGRSQTYYGFVTSLFAATAARGQLAVWFPGLSFPVLLVILFLFLHIVMVADHYLIKRSEIAHNTKQTYIDESPTVQDLQTIKADLKSIKQKLNIEVEND